MDLKKFIPDISNRQSAESQLLDLADCAAGFPRNSRQHRQYSIPFKRDVAEWFLTWGVSPADQEIAGFLGINTCLLCRWCKWYETGKLDMQNTVAVSRLRTPAPSLEARIERQLEILRSGAQRTEEAARAAREKLSAFERKVQAYRELEQEEWL